MRQVEAGSGPLLSSLFSPLFFCVSTTLQLRNSVSKLETETLETLETLFLIYNSVENLQFKP